MDFENDVAILEAAETLVREFLGLLDWDEEESYWYCLALREILINAIVHGNKNDPRKRVYLTLEEENDNGVRATVVDEGKGLTIPEIPAILEQENLFKTSGRGLFMVRNIVNEIKIERTKEGALMVTLWKSKKIRRSV